MPKATTTNSIPIAYPSVRLRAQPDNARRQANNHLWWDAVRSDFDTRVQARRFPFKCRGLLSLVAVGGRRHVR